MTTIVERHPEINLETKAETRIDVVAEAERVVAKKGRVETYVWGTLRLGMGWIFFWAFIDKVFGLGFATAPDGAWLAGGSPTFGFLTFGTKGPFAELYGAMAGNVLVDWLFMLGLAYVGVALLLGLTVKLGAYTGILMLTLMYTAASILPEHNPFLDDHIIYAVIMIGLAATATGATMGLGRRWATIPLVKRYPILE
jgi:thiosulfate dehydrogenase [quinone] large subunit